MVTTWTTEGPRDLGNVSITSQRVFQSPCEWGMTSPRRNWQFRTFLSLDCLPSRDFATAVLLPVLVSVVLKLSDSLWTQTGCCRPGYMAYGAFGQVASHELTVRWCVSWIIFSLLTYVLSTRSTQQAACTIRRANCKSGGRTPLVKVSGEFRTALLINIHVSIEWRFEVSDSEEPRSLYHRRWARREDTC